MNNPTNNPFNFTPTPEELQYPCERLDGAGFLWSQWQTEWAECPSCGKHTMRERIRRWEHPLLGSALQVQQRCLRCGHQKDAENYLGF